MTGRLGFGAGGAGGGVIFLALLGGVAGTAGAAGTLLVLLFAFGVDGAQVIHVHNTEISISMGTSLLFIMLSYNLE
jgi:hypothetical protein